MLGVPLPGRFYDLLISVGAKGVPSTTLALRCFSFQDVPENTGGGSAALSEGAVPTIFREAIRVDKPAHAGNLNGADWASCQTRLNRWEGRMEAVFFAQQFPVLSHLMAQSPCTG